MPLEMEEKSKVCSCVKSPFWAFSREFSKPLGLLLASSFPFVHFFVNRVVDSVTHFTDIHTTSVAGPVETIVTFNLTNILVSCKYHSNKLLSRGCMHVHYKKKMLLEFYSKILDK